MKPLLQRTNIILENTWSCKVTESPSDFSVIIDCDIKYLKDVVINDILVILTNIDNSTHQFRIYNIESDVANGQMTIYARSKTFDIAQDSVGKYVALKGYELSDILVQLQENLANKNIDYGNNDSLNNIRITTNINAISPIDIDFTHRNLLSALMGEENSLATAFYFELKREDNELKLLSRRGIDKKMDIFIGKNLNNIRRKVDYSNVVTHVIPYFKTKEQKDKNGNVIVEKDQIIYSQAVTSNVERNMSFRPRTVFYDFSNDEKITNVEELSNAAMNIFNKDGALFNHDKPTIEYTFDINPTSQFIEYDGIKLSSIDLYDELLIYDNTLGLNGHPVIVTKTEFDAINEYMIQFEVVTHKEKNHSAYASASIINQLKKEIDRAVSEVEYLVQDTANGKNKMYYSEEKPNSNPNKPFEDRDGRTLQIGDIWFKKVSGDTNTLEMYIYDRLTSDPNEIAGWYIKRDKYLEIEIEKTNRVIEERNTILDKHLNDFKNDINKANENANQAIVYVTTSIDAELNKIEDNINTIKEELKNDIDSVSTSVNKLPGIIDTKLLDNNKQIGTQITQAAAGVKTDIINDIRGTKTNITTVADGIRAHIEDSKNAMRSEITATASTLNQKIIDEKNNVINEATKIANGSINKVFTDNRFSSITQTLDTLNTEVFGTISPTDTTSSRIDQQADQIQTTVTTANQANRTADEAKTTATQTANSWAVKVLSSNNTGTMNTAAANDIINAISSQTASTVLSQININSEGVKIGGNIVKIDGRTEIEDASIDAAKIKNLDVSHINAFKGDIINLRSKEIEALRVKGPNITIDLQGSGIELQHKSSIFKNFTHSISGQKDVKFLNFDVENRNYNGEVSDLHYINLGMTRNGKGEYNWTTKTLDANDSFSSGNFTGIRIMSRSHPTRPNSGVDEIWIGADAVYMTGLPKFGPKNQGPDRGWLFKNEWYDQGGGERVAVINDDASGISHAQYNKHLYIKPNNKFYYQGSNADGIPDSAHNETMKAGNYNGARSFKLWDFQTFIAAGDILLPFTKRNDSDPEWVSLVSILRALTNSWGRKPVKRHM